MTFDDGYDRGDVLRLFFGHPAGGHEGAPFARRDVVVVADDGDAIVGHYTTVSDKTRGSLYDDEDDPDPTHDVKVKSRTLTIRKSAVVMKREFGSVTVDDVNVREDATDTWSEGEGKNAR